MSNIDGRDMVSALCSDTIAFALKKALNVDSMVLRETKNTLPRGNPAWAKEFTFSHLLFSLRRQDGNLSPDAQYALLRGLQERRARLVPEQSIEVT